MANQNNNGYTPVTTGVRFFTEATENGNRPSIWVKNLRIPVSSIKKGTESTTQSGIQVFRVNAPFVNCREKFTQATGVEPYTTGDTSWIQLTFWRDQVKWFKDWALQEGMPAQVEITVFGTWSVNEFTGQDGTPRKSIQVSVSDFGKITRRRNGDGGNGGNNQQPAPAPQQQAAKPQQQAQQQVPTGVMDDFAFMSEDDGELPF